ncbi:MAG TPA: HD domain-containing protein, partial [Thermodesulfovibrionales bacterium]|nr:HD domain-containing protein [Thermodesulfovibrionales bacterium]
LGHTPKDLDLVCRKARETAADIARHTNASLVPMEKKPDEPCYRLVDRTSPGRYIDLAEMRGRDIAEDLGNRDFTINAMAIEIQNGWSAGRLIDPLRGAEDIRDKKVRMASGRAMIADPLRILRAVRHAAQLDFSIDERTLAEMHAGARLLISVSAERVLTELLLILETGRAAAWFKVMDDIGILPVLFPEIVPMKSCGQNGYHHRDVWGHSLLVMETVEQILSDLSAYFGQSSREIAGSLASGRTPLLKLAAMFHDIGKPMTKGLRRDNRITFYGHDRVGADIAQHIARRLRMPNRSADFMVRIVREHLKPLMLSRSGEREISRMRWFRRLGDDAVWVLILGMADIMSSLGPDSGLEYRKSVITWIQGSARSYFTDLKQKIGAPLLVTGNDLITMGMEPGVALGNLLCKLRLAQDIGRVASREDALCMARELINKRSKGRENRN